MEFNYEKAYFTLAKPAFEGLPERVKDVWLQVANEVKDLSQDHKLNIPMNSFVKEQLGKLTTKELAELSRASYFVGNWRPLYGDPIVPVDAGQTWKVSNCCDQLLRERLAVPSYIRIHKGVLRITYADDDCWLWREVGLATEENLQIILNCNLPFDYNNFERSALIVRNICDDLWPDPEQVPDNSEYLSYLKTKQYKAIEQQEERAKKKLENLKDKFEKAKKEYNGTKWIIDNKVPVNILNVIYYGYTDTFVIGWYKILNEEEKNAIQEVMKDFPYKWEFEKEV